MLILLALLACTPDDPKDSGDASGDTDSGADTATDTWPQPVDEDGDGVTAADGDCDDGDAEKFPGRAEDCNGVDDNCNEAVDEGWPDTDADGTSDCLDAEACDGIDNDGDGGVDEDSPDADADGTADCVDAESCDGVDNNGDGAVDEGFDADGDGFAACDECDDADATVYPGAPEPNDGRDHDCDGLADDGTWAEGDLAITEVMFNPQDYADDDGEWIEVRNVSTRDLDLNGLTIRSDDESHTIDAGGPLLLAPGDHLVLGASADRPWVDYAYSDLILFNEADAVQFLADGVLLDEIAWDDGATMPDPAGASLMVDPWFADAQSNDDPNAWCAATVPWSDMDAGSPGADNELCTTFDHDGDGFSGAEGDCDDGSVDVGPAMVDTWYDGVDTDCDAWSDFDADRDGHDGRDWGGDDCDEARADVSPSAPELCDDANTDEDCDGTADDADTSASGQSTWYADADGDGYGADTTLSACDQPAGHVLDTDDCDDANDAVSPGATEVCGNDVDDDCDGGPSGCGPSGDLELTEADAILTGETAGDQAGYSLAWAGDLDGDGFDDLVVGANAYDGSSRDVGAAYLVYGLPSGESSLSTADARLIGAASSDQVAYDVRPAGDFDGDGLADVLVGSPYVDGGGSEAGAVYLVSGGTTGDFTLSDATATLLGEDPSDAAGIATDGLGDLDGDGLAEVAVGANQDDAGGSNAGAVYIVAGGTSGTFDLSGASAKIVGEDASDTAGSAVRSAGDLNGDGISDLLIGASGDDTSGMDCGATYVVYLPVSGTFDLANADAKLYGDAATEGAYRPAAGDLDGDGDLDLVVGANQARLARVRPGAVYVVLDVPSGTYDLGNADTIVTGADDSSYFGNAVDVGDTDGDGTGDLVVGAYAVTGSAGSPDGAVYLYNGPLAAGALSSTDADSTFAGDRADRAGYAVDASGDADGDGFADILVGGYNSSAGVATGGAAYLILGGQGW